MDEQPRTLQLKLFDESDEDHSGSAKRLAVFVDLENVGRMSADRCQWLVNTLGRRGRVVVRKAVTAQTVRSDALNAALVKTCFEIVHASRNRRAGKNAADIRLTIEAMKVALQQPRVDCFAIAAGDSDYRPLLDELDGLGREVIVVGDPKCVSRALLQSCHEFLEFDSDRPLAPRTGRPFTERDFALLQQCIDAAVNVRVFHPAHVRAMLSQHDAAFHRTYCGSSCFHRFLRAAAQAGVIKLARLETGALAIWRA